MRPALQAAAAFGCARPIRRPARRSRREPTPDIRRVPLPDRNAASRRKRAISHRDEARSYRPADGAATARTAGSVSMTSPAIQPSKSAPSHTRIRKAIEHHHDQGRARDDHGNADGEPQDQKRELTVGGSRNRNHVVEAHDDIGNDDDADRLPERGAGRDLVIFVFRHQQFRCDDSSARPPASFR